MWYRTSDRSRSGPVRIGEHCFIDARRLGDQVVEQEVVRLREPGAPVEEREDLALVALDEPGVGLLVEHRPTELHAVLLAEALDLPVPEHRQPGERRQDRRDAEVLVALAELLERRSSRPGCS